VTHTRVALNDGRCGSETRCMTPAGRPPIYPPTHATPWRAVVSGRCRRGCDERRCAAEEPRDRRRMTWASSRRRERVTCLAIAFRTCPPDRARSVAPCGPNARPRLMSLRDDSEQLGTTNRYESPRVASREDQVHAIHARTAVKRIESRRLGARPERFESYQGHPSGRRSIIRGASGRRSFSAATRRPDEHDELIRQ
jgi:hypothetical protein